MTAKRSVKITGNTCSHAGGDAVSESKKHTGASSFGSSPGSGAEANDLTAKDTQTSAVDLAAGHLLQFIGTQFRIR